LLSHHGRYNSDYSLIAPAPTAHMHHNLCVSITNQDCQKDLPQSNGQLSGFFHLPPSLQLFSASSQASETSCWSFARISGLGFLQTLLSAFLPCCCASFASMHQNSMILFMTYVISSSFHVCPRSKNLNIRNRTKLPLNSTHVSQLQGGIST